MSASLDRATLQQAFRADGFVSIPGFLDAREIATVRSEVDHVLRTVVPTMPTERVYREDPRDPSTLKQLQRLHEHDAALRRRILEGPLADLAGILLDDDPAAQNLQYFDKAPGRNRPTPPHQDGAYFPIRPMNAVTIWLALEDVSLEQGCVRYVRGSHREGLRPHVGSGTLGFSRQVADYGARDRSREVAFPCAAGHVIAHHALTVHRAQGNASADRHRRALGFIYYGASCTVDERARDAYQSRLDAQLHREGRLADSP